MLNADLLWSKRILNLPPYLFAELDRIKSGLREKGVDIIDLSVGDPDLPTPDLIVNRLKEEAANPKNHQYPAYRGSVRFRKTVAAWYQDRFGISLDPETEVIALIGSKEGIAHAPLAFINPGDIGLIPDPGYPVYQTCIDFAGGETVRMPLLESNRFLPDYSKIDGTTAKKSKLIFLNYPNNPTAAVADQAFFDETVEFAKKNQILVCHDAAYTEVCFGGYEPMSFLQAEGAKEFGIEFHSLSKTFNMTGWRIGFAVGNKNAIAGLGKIKNQVDSGAFTAVQEAGISALENWKSLRDQNNRIMEHRRDMVVERLRSMGIDSQVPRATFYIWCKLPEKESDSTKFCARILEETGVCFTPGVGFGESGEGYFRISLTATEVRLQEGLARVEKALAKE